jgi:antitoxin component HigA of HigAB toxin-antitoxin module
MDNDTPLVQYRCMSIELDRIKLKREIRAKGLKHKDLALEIGMTASSFSRCLSGKRGFGNAALKSLLRELKISEDTVRKTAS